MTKLAFLASFLAAFVTMDEQLFDGAATRWTWDVLSVTSQAAEKQVLHWVHYGRRH